jgi:hypothetical protein
MAEAKRVQRTLVRRRLAYDVPARIDRIWPALEGAMCGGIISRDDRIIEWAWAILNYAEADQPM